jgi:hypothetical protein
MNIRIIFALIVLWSANAASAYEIKAKQSVHEAITRLALQCLQEQSNLDTPPQDCGTEDGAIENIATHSKSLRTNFNRLEAATRWADDPTRDLYSPLSFLKFLWGTAPGLKNCEKGEDATAALSVPHGRGLLCASHYGRLQFFHSMAALDEEENVELTRRKVLEWTLFSYKAATGRVDLQQDHCGYWDKQAASAGSKIAAELAPANFPYCERTKAKTPWRVATLFSMRCWTPKGTVGCTQYVHESRARRAAAGALLHAIQDSYSQSHVVRGPIPAGLEFKPTADCGKPARFYAYSLKNQAHHGEADTAPPLGDACRTSPRPAHDVVTATAGAIWHLCRNSPPQVMLDYLTDRIYGEPAPALGSVASGPEGSAAPFPKQCALIGGMGTR